jgi:hypothetical protein
MEYRTVFDVATAGDQSGNFLVIGLFLVVSGLIAVALRNRLSAWRKTSGGTKVFPFVFLGFGVLWTLLSLSAIHRQHDHLTAPQDDKRVHVVEGVVTNFAPMPFSGHTRERFCVSSECFEYSDYIVTGGFNNTSSHGGPIREGLPVRVTYRDRTIVKLEISKEIKGPNSN